MDNNRDCFVMNQICAALFSLTNKIQIDSVKYAMEKEHRKLNNKIINIR